MSRVTSASGAAPAKYLENGPELWLAAWPWPEGDTHKHARGRLAIVGSSPSRTGATRLAARGGMRIGAGVITVLSPPASVLIYAGALEAAILKAFRSEEELVELARPAQAVVIGPNAGVTEQTRERMRRLAELDAALVLDADAISAFAGRAEELFASTRERDVLTPHEQEFRRVFPELLETLGRETAAAQAARQAGCVVVLKGARTVIAAPDGRLAVNGCGTAWLATAGSGDVLAGFAGGLIAQGLASFEAACAAVWAHAQAGARFGPGLTAEDLPDAVLPVLRELYARRQGASSRPTG